MKKKWGLALSSFGVKSSYHLGVWKYLKEAGFYRNIKAISGTSIGALNSCLFVLDNYDLAFRVWTQDIENTILPIDFEDLFERMSKIEKLGSKMKLLSSYKKVLSSTGVFSREDGLKKLIKCLDLDYVERIDLPVYACATSADTLRAKYFKLNGNHKYDIENMLLASTSIPVIYPIQDINGKSYYDGCLVNNVPIKPLYDEGCTDIIVVKLNSKKTRRSKKNNINTYEIYPKNDIDNFFDGFFSSSPYDAIELIKQGYNDAKDVLESVINIKKNWYD